MSTKKRKRSTKPQPKISAPARIPASDDLDNDELGFTANLSDDDQQQAETIDSEQELQETPDEKRLRLAKEYLQQIQGNNVIQDTYTIASRLKDEAMEQRGRIHRQVAEQLLEKQFNVSDVMILKGHQRPVTCVAITHDDKFVFSAGKDCMIYKCLCYPFKYVILKGDIETGKKIWRINDKNYKQILCIAISSDGRYLAYGGIHPKHEITIHDPINNKRIDAFKGHRDTVSCLAFRLGSSQLFSGSFDRTVKIWNTEAMSYVDTLYGHQSEITALDCGVKERAISCGNDKSVRIWKVIEETQLVFRGQQGTIDCVALLNDDKFISGSDDGYQHTSEKLSYRTLALWWAQKKKPVSVAKEPHEGKWITSVAAFKHSDLIACGSHNGFITLWKADPQSSQLFQTMQISVEGFVNSLQFSRNGQFLVAGIGREHRLGRWDVLKGAKNCVKIIPLNLDLNSNSKFQTKSKQF